jgi:hypothetical protein
MESKLLLAAFVALWACSVDAQEGNITIMGDIDVSGSFRTTAINSESVTIDGSMSVSYAVQGESITVSKGTIGVLHTKAMAGPQGSVHFAGEMQLGSLSVNGTTSAASFIQNDVVQWALRHHDDFEGQINGWDSTETSSCDGFDKHLGGHCQETGGSVKKVFTDLGEHKSLRLQAQYHFLDSWENERAWAKINGKTVWTDTNDIRGLHPSALNLCGGASPDGKFATTVDVVIPHSDGQVEIEFGADLDEHPCDESFGIDDVSISVR